MVALFNSIIFQGVHRYVPVFTKRSLIAFDGKAFK